MTWGLLLVAGLLEVVGVMCINEYHAKGSRKSLIFFALAFGASLFFLQKVMTQIPMALAYAVWTGIGTCGGGLVGIWFYGESKEPRRLAFMGLILAGTIGLRLVA